MTYLRKLLLENLIWETELWVQPTDRQIRLALTPEEWQQFKQRRDGFGSATPPREVVANLNWYLERITEADKLFHRAELLSSRHGNRATIIRLYKEAERLYEAALESLEEALADYPDICIWLDRPVNLGPVNCNISPDPDGVPRLINSRSQFNARTPANKIKKRELLLSVLRDSLYRLEHGITLVSRNLAKERRGCLHHLGYRIDLNEEPTLDYEG